MTDESWPTLAEKNLENVKKLLARVDRLTAERDTAEAVLESLQNKFAQVTGENVRLLRVIQDALHCLEANKTPNRKSLEQALHQDTTP